MAETPPAPDRSKMLPALRLVWRFTFQYKPQLAGALVSLVTAAVATLWIPRTFKLVVDNGFATNAAASEIGPYFEGLLGVVVVLAVATAGRFYFVSWLGERTVADLRMAVHRNLLTLSPGWFEENRPSEIASRLTADTAIVEGIVSTTVSIALRNLLVGIGGVLYLFALAPKLAAYLIVGIPVIVLPIMWLGGRVRKLSRSSQDRIADIGSIASETLGAMKIVQAFGQEPREGDRFEAAVERGFQTAKKRFATRAVMTAFVIGMLFAAITLIMWDAVSDVAAGRTTELLAQRPEIAAPAHPVALPDPARGAVSFADVTFHYPTRPEIAALADFSLAVAPGETVAVVGPSGAGKSTLFQLIQRFYDPAAGTIAVDGVDVRSADPAAIRERIAMVPQETVIFAASARDNLRYGRWQASDDQLWAAADAANATAFLRALPDGLDTYLGEGGARLSGGQRQRVAIARALLRDAPILLLDEATSALDAESERLVQDALDRLMTNRTTLVIAHRLATVRAASRIIVMDHGRIVETGRHGELIANGALYARLANLQFHEGA